jgi:hypothetical protein
MLGLPVKRNEQVILVRLNNRLALSLLVYLEYKSQLSFQEELMRQEFFEHYPKSDEFFESLLQNCTFAFDTNVLLNLYSSQPATRANFLAIMEVLKSRIFIPHQAAFEYHNHRLSRFYVVEETMGSFTTSLSTHLENVQKFKMPPVIDGAQLDDLTNELVEAIESVKAAVLTSVKKYQAECESLRDTIAELFIGNVGRCWTPSELEDGRARAKKRFDQKTPPGFLDMEKTKSLANDPSDKSGATPGDPFGDAIIWFQLLEIGEQKGSLVFVTDDQKHDWWRKRKDQIVGPRPELIREMKDVAHCDFYMYTSEQFLKHAKKFAEIDVTELNAAITEVAEWHMQPKTIMSKLTISQPGQPTVTEFNASGKQLYLASDISSICLYMRDSLRELLRINAQRNEINLSFGLPDEELVAQQKHVLGEHLTAIAFTALHLAEKGRNEGLGSISWGVLNEMFKEARATLRKINELDENLDIN